ncbi:MAG: HupE/UreJ family protein [Hymenobacteraceae bacterium]|nr:HupE/UreJ family protein [Hymenobacteraceae bacterium]MDX5395799.1 HupE/UreJ family protein [Hymenobacteraceae bacterium]MDX5511854.1 HupE/UreJ family protein [Hymenobacteraceae bacterium]
MNTSVFSTYLEVGFEHILDLQAYDHLVFLLAMAAIYTLPDWRKVLLLVTSFTIGHSITLALSTFNIIRFNTALIEFLIPVTILITAVANFFKLKGGAKKQPLLLSVHNLLAIGFGLIHGMGFSNYLKMLLGKSQSVALELFAFNVGIELAQIVIVLCLLLLNFLLLRLFKLKQRDWIMVLSSIAGGIALLLILQQL